MIADARQIFYSASPDNNDGVLLEIVALARDIGGYLLAVGEADSGHLSEGGVWLLGGNGKNFKADSPLKGRRRDNRSILDGVEI